MLKVGLTGGTGSGKSSVAALLAARGAVVVDADRLAREVVASGTDGLAAVVAEFGDDVLAPGGALDRAVLARQVFADPDRRQALEAITHPRIAARTRELVAKAPPDAVLVHDVPLLVEKEMGPRYHLVVVVDAPEDDRVARLVGRGLDADDAHARIAAQASEADRRAAADVWLGNSGSHDELETAVDRLWRQRLVPFERNVRAGVPAPRPDLVRLVDPDPTWGAQAARLLARVRVAVGDAATSAAHVGSTAVPALAAKDVLDLQLVVPDLAAADAVQVPLGEAGLVRLAGDWWDDEPRGRAHKRVHAAADPGRAVNLHVRTPGWSSRMHVLLRDWLRAHDGERDAYAAVKARAAGQPVRAYTDAKGPWLRDAYRRAQAWARETGWRSS